MSNENSEFSTPNHITVQYFETLTRQVARTKTAPETSFRQEGLLAIITGVTVAEVFMNFYFRVIVSEPEFKHFEQRLLNDLDKRRSLEWKIKQWPREILAKELPKSSPAIAAFVELKQIRNDLVHFTSTHSSVHVKPNLIVHGLVNTKRYANLSVDYVEQIPSVVLGFAKELMFLRGATTSDIGQLFHLWFGIPCLLHQT